MFIQPIVRKATRLALIPLFILALAGCGDGTGDMDPHGDEHEEHDHEGEHAEEHDGEFPGRLMVMDAENHELQVFDLESEQVVATFALRQSTASGFGTLLRTTSDGRYGFALQRTGHFSPDNDPDANQIMVIDSGLTTEGHGDHTDPVWGPPTRLDYRLGHGGGEIGLYRPIHWSSHHGLTAVFYDGSRHPDDDAQNVNGVAVAYEDSDWGSQTLPEPIFELDVGSYMHGGVVAFHDNLFIVSVGMNEDEGGLAYSSLPRGVATYHADAEDVEDDIVQDFRGRCPRLHGEAASGDYVAFGCNEGPEDDDNENYMGPEITERSGVLVLTYDEASDSFKAAEVAYPDDGKETTSGGVRGGMGPSKGIFMTTYGEHFLKIVASEIMDGTDAGSELVRVEADSGRHRGYAFEPADHNFPMGEGRFVVLTGTGNLYIFDLTVPMGDELVGQVPGIVDAECPEIGCPSLALAPGFAYVTDPANDRVRVVHLEDAEIEDDLTMNAPTQLAVLGWFALEEELEFH
jgi:hypothetical protein